MDAMYLRLIQNKFSYYLVDNGNFYVLVKSDDLFRDAAFERMLHKGPRPIQEWQAAGFSVRGIPKNSVRRVSLRGSDSIQEVEMRVHNENMLFYPAEPYEENFLRTFFLHKDVVRILITEREICESRCRKNSVTILIYLFAFTIDFVFLLFPRPYWLWSALCIFTQLASVGLHLLLPFTFELDGWRRKGEAFKPGNLIGIPVASGWLLLMRICTVFHLTTRTFLLIVAFALVLSLLLLIAIVLRRRACGRYYCTPLWQFLGGWLMMTFMSIGAVGHFYLLLL